MCGGKEEFVGVWLWRCVVVRDGDKNEGWGKNVLWRVAVELLVTVYIIVGGL